MTIPAVDSIEMPEVLTIGVLALQGAFIEHIHYLQRLDIQGHRINAIAVRTKPELESCQALIIPGGESTTIQLVAAHTPGLLEALQAFVRDPKRPVWGTCAGMILMAESDGIGGGKVIKGREARGWGGIKGLKVWRNLYGTQLESFEIGLIIPGLSNPSKPFNLIFIRAPAVHSLTRPPGTWQDSSDSSNPTPVDSSNPTSVDSSNPSTSTETLCTLPIECQPPAPPSDSPLGAPNIDDLGKVMIRQGRKMVTSFHPELSGDVRIHEYWVKKCVLGRL
ncbi:putative pyridoxine metabolism-related protein [Naematelia encephala]|uniref:glutaminase n=1 Tax=Naematelia encephala TaxID=71784 RepID=A0A1Y2BHC7_9TREE|nr:putative pyridoxine metabolism-related protein [Naematelia encephala]